MVLKRNILLIIYMFLSLIISTLTWDYDKNGKDWPKSCKTGLQSPINIEIPLTYKELDVDFNYEGLPTEHMLYHDSNNLILEGDFGYLQYNGKIYPSTHALFFSPSQHTVSSEKYPLELQIVHQDDEGNKITSCIMFKKSKKDYSLFLSKLGFNDDSFKNMVPLKKTTITTEIDLSKYINNNKTFFIYDAQDPIPPCTKSNRYYILADVLIANEAQLSKFPVMAKNKYRSNQPRLNRDIYITVQSSNLDEEKELNAKISKRNEMRVKRAEVLSAMKDKYSEDSAFVPKGSIKKLDTLSSVTVPFESVTQLLDLIEKETKFTEVNILTGDTLKNKNSIAQDKDIPTTKRTNTRINLALKFSKWIKLLNKLSNGQNVLDEQIKEMILLQIKLLEKELDDNHYEPYLKYAKAEKDFLKNKNEQKKSSFIEIDTKIQNDNNNKEINKEDIQQNEKENIKKELIKKDYEKLEKLLNDSIKYEDENSPYNVNFSVLQEIIDNANGTIAMSEKNDPRAEIFELTSWSRDCKVANYLSPVNIDLNTIEKKIKKKDVLTFSFKKPSGKLYVMNDDFKIIVQATGGFGKIKYYDHEYSVSKIALSSPSEHTFTDMEKRYYFEIQIICVDGFDNYAAISVPLKIGKKELEFLNPIGFNAINNNLYLRKIRNNVMVEIKISESVQNQMDLSKLLNDNNQFAYYIGSITTRPCKGNVKWFVSLNPVSFTQAQLDIFPIMYGRFRNVRGLHPVNGRNIQLLE